jgi:hypothetical protein
MLPDTNGVPYMDVKRPSILVSLSDDELEKVAPLTEEAIDRALAKGREERKAAEGCEPPAPSNSRVLFR